MQPCRSDTEHRARRAAAPWSMWHTQHQTEEHLLNQNGCLSTKHFGLKKKKKKQCRSRLGCRAHNLPNKSASDKSPEEWLSTQAGLGVSSPASTAADPQMAKQGLVQTNHAAELQPLTRANPAAGVEKIPLCHVQPFTPTSTFALTHSEVGIILQ